MIDFHTDTVYQLVMNNSSETLCRNSYAVDAERMIKGGVKAVCFALFTPEENDLGLTRWQMLSRLHDRFVRDVENSNGLLRQASSSKEIENNISSAVLTVEDKVPMSGNLYSMDPVWTVNGSEIMDIYTSYEFTGGMGRYTCYYLASNAGLIDVALNIEMRFNDAPAGEDVKTASTSATFEVVPCDARNSFWGDSVDITMYREPGLVKFGTGASEETYIGEGNSSISGVENYGVGSVDLTYVFQNGGLSSIEELFRLTVDGGNYGYVAEVFDFALKTLETSYAGGKVAGRSIILNTEDPDIIQVANKYKAGSSLTSDEMKLLGEGMVKGRVRVQSAMTSENTEIVFTTEALPDSNSANVVLTYSRR